EQRKAGGGAAAHLGIDLEERIGAQQRGLPADPQPPSARLAVGHAFQSPPEQRSHRAENLRHRVEADAADEMNFFRNHGAYPSRFLSWLLPALPLGVARPWPRGAACAGRAPP